MYCSQCNQLLNEGSLYCESCGYRHAVAEQRAKVESVKSQIRGVVAAQLSSVLFLVMTICFTALLATQAVAMLTGGIGAFISGILPAIFMIISVVGMWKSFAKGKKGVVDAPAIKNISMYDAYSRVLLTIAIVAYGILAAIGALLIFKTTSAIGSTIGEKEAATIGGFIGVIIFLITMGIGIAIMVCFRKIYVNRRRFFTELAHTAISGDYRVKKAPVVGSWILGVLMVISVISAIGLWALLGVLTEMMSAFIAELGDTAEAEALLEAFEEAIESLSVTFVISAISSVVGAAYYICCAIWMSAVHKAELANASVITSESKRLAKIEIATRQAIAQRENEKRQAEAERRQAEEEEKLRAIEAERKAAELEAQNNQSTMQEQQQQLMQMFMQQMMAQNAETFANMMNNIVASSSTPTAAPIAEEAPVAEETPAPEETPEAAEETPVGE